MLDKSLDWQSQLSWTTVWYLQKVVEGDVVFNTNSVAAFKAAAKTVDYVVKEQEGRTSPESLQTDRVSLHLFRSRWLLTLSGLPCVGDKLLYDGVFWLVDSVDYTDWDDNGAYQRYVVHCLKSKRSPTA